jgi:hypothetical protein
MSSLLLVARDRLDTMYFIISYITNNEPCLNEAPFEYSGPDRDPAIDCSVVYPLPPPLGLLEGSLISTSVSHRQAYVFRRSNP